MTTGDTISAGLGTVSNLLNLGTDIINMMAQQDQLDHQIRMEDMRWASYERRVRASAISSQLLLEQLRRIAQRQVDVSRELSTTRKRHELLKTEIDANNQLASNKAAIDAREVLTPRFNGSPVA